MKDRAWLCYAAACRVCVLLARAVQPMLTRRQCMLVPLQHPSVRQRLGLPECELLSSMQSVISGGESDKLQAGRTRLVIAGGSGFLGGILAAHFAELKWDVVILSRRPVMESASVRWVAWDVDRPVEWAGCLEGADALVNLAGRSVDCRYHERNRKEILESRVGTTRVLGEVLAQCARPPRVWLNASTATIYKHSIEVAMDEATGRTGATPEARDAFSVEVARAWESELEQARTPAARKVAMRTAMVLGTARNSVFPVLRRLVRLGLGGSMAGGNQYVSWIHETDFCRAVGWLIDHPGLEGPVNLAAPNPLPNREVMRILRRSCGARIGLPAARWMLEAGAFVLRTETELVIKSRRVVPAKLAGSGFQFEFPCFEAAVADLQNRRGSRHAFPTGA